MRATLFNASIILVAISAVFGVASYAERPASAQIGNTNPQFNRDITFGNNTMADFSATRTAQAADFTNRVTRCVVVMDIAALTFALHSVHELVVTEWG